MIAEESADSIGYRGNVLAEYVFLHGFSLGYIKEWHLIVLESLVEEVPQSPFYQAMYGCYESDENYQIALNIMGDEERFPHGKLPENVNEELWDWSDASQYPLYALVKGVLEHCHE